MTNPLTNTMTEATDLKAELEPLATESGELTDDRPTITVEYETRNGNTRTRSGEIWRVGNGGSFDDAVIRFSQNAGEQDEDPYFIRVRNGNATLFSISLASSTESELGPITNVEVDGLPESDDEDDDINPMDAFDEPDEITEGMELTGRSKSVYVIESIHGDMATVQVWNGDRRGRRERLPLDGLQQDYENGTLEVV